MHETNETYTGQFVQQAADIKPTFLGWLFVACTAVVMIMGTIKIGLIWFT